MVPALGAYVPALGPPPPGAGIGLARERIAHIDTVEACEAPRFASRAPSPPGDRPRHFRARRRAAGGRGWRILMLPENDSVLGRVVAGAGAQARQQRVAGVRTATEPARSPGRTRSRSTGRLRPTLAPEPEARSRSGRSLSYLRSALRRRQSPLPPPSLHPASRGCVRRTTESTLSGAAACARCAPRSGQIFVLLRVVSERSMARDGCSS